MPTLLCWPRPATWCRRSKLGSCAMRDLVALLKLRHWRDQEKWLPCSKCSSAQRGEGEAGGRPWPWGGTALLAGGRSPSSMRCVVAGDDPGGRPRGDVGAGAAGSGPGTDGTVGVGGAGPGAEAGPRSMGSGTGANVNLEARPSLEGRGWLGLGAGPGWAGVGGAGAGLGWVCMGTPGLGAPPPSSQPNARQGMGGGWSPEGVEGTRYVWGVRVGESGGCQVGVSLPCPVLSCRLE